MCMTGTREPHARQRPRIMSHENTGMRSRAESSTLHELHLERPLFQDCPVYARSATTITKLAMSAPSRKKKTRNSCMQVYISIRHTQNGPPRNPGGCFLKQTDNGKTPTAPPVG